MNYDFIQNYCLQKTNAKEDNRNGWDDIRYTIGGKAFAIVGNDISGNKIITIKHSPEHGEELRAKHAGVFPAYSMKKIHWSSAMLNGQVAEDVLKEILDDSYDFVFSSLSEKRQKDIIMSTEVKKPDYDDDDDD